jgi:hypothetical protein
LNSVIGALLNYTIIHGNSNNLPELLELFELLSGGSTESGIVVFKCLFQQLKLQRSQKVWLLSGSPHQTKYKRSAMTAMTWIVNPNPVLPTPLGGDKAAGIPPTSGSLLTIYYDCHL